MFNLILAGMWLALLITNVRMYCKITDEVDGLKWWASVLLILWLSAVSIMFLWHLIDYISFVLKG